jgi:2-polyprenyl-3-methyl-5-hydroxy-6-metoxy-1,4-benzoquinol methylase
LLNDFLKSLRDCEDLEKVLRTAARVEIDPASLEWLAEIEGLLARSEWVLADASQHGLDAQLELGEFCQRYKDVLEAAIVIPESGQWLLKPKKKAATPSAGASSSEIRSAYSTHYYLTDCGGFDEFLRMKGTRLEDARQAVVATLASAAPRGRALDLGCGRGEVSFELSRLGFEVTAIDYSAEAIELATAALEGQSPESRWVEFHCGDVNQVPLEGPYQVAVAGDLVEHLSQDELDKLYGRVARELSGDGLFVVHTFPNKWHYRYHYPKVRRKAAALGGWMPLEPRTRFERLVHINEQSPRELRRQLTRHFPHVALWFGKIDSPIDHLERRFRLEELRAAPDLFAIAAHHPLDPHRFTKLFRMQAIDAQSSRRIQVNVLHCPAHADAGQTFRVVASLQNRTGTDLRSDPPFPVRLAYHWYSPDKRECLIYDGKRTHLRPALRDGQALDYEMIVEAPKTTGPAVLRVTCVQEHVRWMDVPQIMVFDDASVLIG